ncbi:hypothetical protein NECAME_12790 [Necator americanus]|uniref:Uncharacterized protein n=1 Tax=Necator americanus TaxID=51031 RepID=W2T0C3_NECAM|nr:hypothetical protein NECAME_12790 [Necator americanus]ETN74701.1 hypothetical protein NECAME_12790 [Necator americanus]
MSVFVLISDPFIDFGKALFEISTKFFLDAMNVFAQATDEVPEGEQGIIKLSCPHSTSADMLLNISYTMKYDNKELQEAVDAMEKAQKSHFSHRTDTSSCTDDGKEFSDPPVVVAVLRCP